MARPKRPYPGMRGEYVVLQHIGRGEWVCVVGANSTEVARAKARSYPGETRIVTNALGAPRDPAVPGLEGL